MLHTIVCTSNKGALAVWVLQSAPDQVTWKCMDKLPYSFQGIDLNSSCGQFTTRDIHLMCTIYNIKPHLTWVRGLRQPSCCQWWTMAEPADLRGKRYMISNWKVSPWVQCMWKLKVPIHYGNLLYIMHYMVTTWFSGSLWSETSFWDADLLHTKTKHQIIRSMPLTFPMGTKEDHNEILPYDSNLLQWIDSYLSDCEQSTHQRSSLRLV